MILSGKYTVFFGETQTLVGTSELINKLSLHTLKQSHHNNNMNKLYYLTILAITMSFISCDRQASLAKEIAGTWTGNPERVESPQTDVTITTTDTYCFTPDGGTPGGNVIITGVLSVNAPMQGTDSVTSPYCVSAAASATINGTWNVYDEDDMEMILDPRSLTVSVDPKALELRSNAITGEQSPQIDSIAPALASQIKHLVTTAMTEHYLGQRHLEDVKVDKTSMKFEIDIPDGEDIHMSLRRQGDVVPSSK